MKKTILLAILFFILLVLILSLIPFPKKETKNHQASAPAPSPAPVKVTKTKDAGATPQGFPDIPLNGKEEILSSYTLGYNNGKGTEQKVIDFLSAKSVKENFSFYGKWAKENGWKIIHQSNIVGINKTARIILEKDAKFFTITIKEDSKAGKSAINISY